MQGSSASFSPNEWDNPGARSPMVIGHLRQRGLTLVWDIPGWLIPWQAMRPAFLMMSLWWTSLYASLIHRRTLRIPGGCCGIFWSLFVRGGNLTKFKFYVTETFRPVETMLVASFWISYPITMDQINQSAPRKWRGHRRCQKLLDGSEMRPAKLRARLQIWEIIWILNGEEIK